MDGGEDAAATLKRRVFLGCVDGGEDAAATAKLTNLLKPAPPNLPTSLGLAVRRRGRRRYTFQCS